MMFKKEKGKTKSERVGTSLLFTFSLLLFTSAATAAELPAGYTAVEYIESTKGGGQYIDTEYTANANTKVVMDAYLPPVEKQNDDSVVLFGTRTSGTWSEKAFSIQLLGLKCIRFAYNGEYVDSPNRTFDERITITCDKEKVVWTGVDPGSASVTVSPLAQSKSVLYVFGDNTVSGDGEKRNGAFNPSVMRLYSFKIYEGNVLKRDFVPCVKKTSGNAGLYDVVEGKFYPNRGGDSFLYPDCPDFISITQANFKNFRTLRGGSYCFTEDVTFTAAATESALKVDGGAMVEIVVPKNIQVRLAGGAANGTTGAGAGIEVPPGATLTIRGEGELFATGGAGGTGVNGGNCSHWSWTDAKGLGTHGGGGGAGGGGAGAGIGGKGGAGGTGGEGGYSEFKRKVMSGYGRNGGNGGNGTEGSKGGDCGTVNIRGSVTVLAASGKGGRGGAEGERDDRWWTGDRPYGCVGYAGGGGGGAGGSPAAAAAVAAVAAVAAPRAALSRDSRNRTTSTTPNTSPMALRVLAASRRTRDATAIPWSVGGRERPPKVTRVLFGAVRVAMAARRARGAGTAR